MNKPIPTSSNEQQVSDLVTIQLAKCCERGMMMNISRYTHLFKLVFVILLALLLAGLVFLTLVPQPSQAQGDSASLVVTDVVYIDTDHYAITQALSAGSVTIPFSTGLNIAAGDELLIITMQGPTETVVGTYETATVEDVSGAVITLTNPLSNAYDGTLFKVMAQRVPSYTSVIVEDGGILTAHAWDGTTGGIVFFRAQTVTVESGGVISVTGLGYRGGGTNGPSGDGYQGESIRGVGTYGGYGGGTSGPNDGGGGVYVNGAGGNYGGNATNAQPYNGSAGQAGEIYGSQELERLHLGSGGGGGHNNSGQPRGGNGGGIIYLESEQLIVLGSIEANGSPAIAGGGFWAAGGGSGGSIYLNVTDAILGDDQVIALGGSTSCGGSACGGVGGIGRIRLDYNILSGSTSPSPYTSFIPKPGSALAFDGNDYVDLGNDEAFNITNELTIEAWVKASAGNYRTILSKGYYTGDLAYTLRLTGDSEGPQAFFSIGTTSGMIFPGYNGSSSTPNLENDSWYHLAGTYDGTQACFYINGEEFDCESVTGQIITNTLPLLIGKLSTVHPQIEYYSGLIDDIRLWNVARTQAEITSTMNVPLAGNEPGLVGYWKFDEGSGQVVYNSHL